jgi:diguanylate cyclase (GGDEF)-like protein
VVYPVLLENTLSNHNEDLVALSSALTSEQEHLMLMVVDWAKWDDSFLFMKDRIPKYIYSNIMTSTFQDANLESIIYINNNKDLWFSASYDLEEKVAVYNKPLEYFPSLMASIKLPRDNDYDHSGYAYSDSGPVLYSIVSIQDSYQNHAGNGYLIFTRSLNTTFFDGIKKITGTNFDVIRKETGDSLFDAPIIVSVATEYDRSILDINGDELVTLVVRYPKSSLPIMIDNLTIWIVFTLCCLPFLLAYSLFFFVVSPMQRMSKKVQRMKSEGSIVGFKHFYYINELAVFQGALNELFEKVNENQSSLTLMSLTDGLTGINNRRAFDQDIVVTWRTSARLHQPLALIMIDIDFFKRLNDSLGHSKGDEALQAVASALQQICRRSSDNVYRYGGEEFAIILLLEDVGHLMEMLSLIHKTISNIYCIHPDSSISDQLTVSCGVCLLDQPGAWMQSEPALKAILLADEALYESKANGRNCHTVKRLVGHEVI